MDIVDHKTRSRMMASIRAFDTKPELFIRKHLYSLGFRYRLHRKDLPGKPDITLPKYQAVVFINGCFWHGHDCHLFRSPKTNRSFWQEKIAANRARDQKNVSTLRARGWRVVVIWECALSGVQTDRCRQHVVEPLRIWLLSSSPNLEIDSSFVGDEAARM